MTKQVLTVTPWLFLLGDTTHTSHPSLPTLHFPTQRCNLRTRPCPSRLLLPLCSTHLLLAAGMGGPSSASCFLGSLPQPLSSPLLTNPSCGDHGLHGFTSARLSKGWLKLGPGRWDGECPALGKRTLVSMRLGVRQPLPLPPRPAARAALPAKSPSPDPPASPRQT